jgi:hypothetical protein
MHNDVIMIITCVCSFVDLEVFAAREDFSAAREGAGEGLLARVHADVVDELVLGLEGLELSGASLPVACVARLFRAADVLDGDVRDDLVHG